MDYHDRVNCVYEDSYGYLWVGTSNGLGRYDGKKFTNYGFSEGLPYLQISAIFEDSRHRLWVGSTKGIVQLLGNKFITFKTNDSADYPGTYGFYETADKNVWALTNKGIYNLKNNLWTRISVYPSYEKRPCKEIIPLSSGLLFNYGNILIKKNNNGDWSIVSKSPDETDFGYFNSMQEYAGKVYVSVHNRLYGIDNDSLKLLIDSIPALSQFNYYVDGDRCFVTIEGRGLFVYKFSGTKQLSSSNPIFFLIFTGTNIAIYG